MEAKVNTLTLVNGKIEFENEFENDINVFEGYKETDVLFSGLDEDDKTFAVDNLKQFTDFVIADSDKGFLRLKISDDVLPMGLVIGLSRRFANTVISVVSKERLEW